MIQKKISALVEWRRGGYSETYHIVPGTRYRSGQVPGIYSITRRDLSLRRDGLRRRRSNMFIKLLQYKILPYRYLQCSNSDMLSNC